MAFTRIEEGSLSASSHSKLGPRLEVLGEEGREQKG